MKLLQPDARFAQRTQHYESIDEAKRQEVEEEEAEMIGATAGVDAGDSVDEEDRSRAMGVSGNGENDRRGHGGKQAADSAVSRIGIEEPLQRSA